MRVARVQAARENDLTATIKTKTITIFIFFLVQSRISPDRPPPRRRPGRNSPDRNTAAAAATAAEKKTHQAQIHQIQTAKAAATAAEKKARQAAEAELMPHLSSSELERLRALGWTAEVEAELGRLHVEEYCRNAGNK